LAGFFLGFRLFAQRFCFGFAGLALFFFGFAALCFGFFTLLAGFFLGFAALAVFLFLGISCRRLLNALFKSSRTSILDLKNPSMERPLRKCGSFSADLVASKALRHPVIFKMKSETLLCSSSFVTFSGIPSAFESVLLYSAKMSSCLSASCSCNICSSLGGSLCKRSIFLSNSVMLQVPFCFGLLTETNIIYCK
jgi:hypothetical protein